jgi:Glycosyl hydrolase family 12
MSLRLRSVSVYACAVSLVFACGGSSNVTGAGGIDANGDKVPDDIGKLADADKNGAADQIDINKDGTPDGWALDTDGDGTGDALLLDTDCDGIFESYDTDGDGKANFSSGSKLPGTPPAGCMTPPVSGGGTGGSPSTGGSTGTSGSTGTAGTGGSAPVDSELGKGAYQGTGETTDRYWEDNVARNGVGYKFIANGWGPGFQNHNISYNGTSFTIVSFNGTRGDKYEPAGFPTMFCGLYSEKQSEGSCGLPADVASLKQIRTGMRWKANGNTAAYNTSWDIWLGNGGSLSSYLMVWLRDPPQEQPAGAGALTGVTVAGVPGTWKTVVGNVNGRPIVNYVKDEGQDLAELEFDVMAFYNDAKMRNYNLPGSQILSVAVGFEIWAGPITNLVLEDFYVDVKK